jgi:pimeloyl-ACP methyl ester carboxylesterase
MAIHVEEHPGRAPATVWLHHGVGTASAWDALLPMAANGRRALAYDRRGFGASSRDREFGARLFEEDAADLARLLGDRAAAPAHLVGHSDGGTIALLCAARHPGLVLSVAAVATHVRSDEVTVGTLRRMGPPDRWEDGLRLYLRRVHGEDWEQVAGAWHRLWTESAWSAGWSIEEELPAVRCPVLVCQDRRDPLAPPLHAEAIAAAVPHARLSWWDTGSHDLHRRDGRRFATELLALWEEAEAGARPAGRCAG